MELYMFDVFNQLNFPQWSHNVWNPFLSPLHGESHTEGFPSIREIYENCVQDPDKMYHYKKFSEEGFNKHFKELDINYTINAHGYRSPPFRSDKKVKIIVIGCSQVFGIGIDDKSTWAQQLKTIISKRFNTENIEVFNLGTPGASSDTNTTQIYQLIDIIKPNIVFWLPTYWRRYSVGHGLYNRDKEIWTRLEDTEKLVSNNSSYSSMAEHSNLDILPNAKMELKTFNISSHQRKVILGGCLDIQTRYQNFCKNFSIISDLCKYRNIIFYSFCNIRQIENLLKSIINEQYFFISNEKDYLKILSLPSKKQKHSREGLEELFFEYCLFKNYKNQSSMILTDQLVPELLKIINKKNNGEYNNYIDGIFDYQDPRLKGRDEYHFGHFHNTLIAEISYSVIEKDIAKLLNTT